MRAFILISTCLFVSGGSLAFASMVSAADMEPMSDEEMSDVSGQGVGIVMEDFRFAHGHDSGAGKTFKLTGITNEAGEDVTVLVDNLYIGGAGSKFGNSLQTVNLGRLSNPFSMRLRDGDSIASSPKGKAVFELAAPSKEGGSATSDPMDLGFATTVQSGGKSQKLNIHAESAVVDGSYIRFWGSKPGESRQELRGQIQANFQTDRLSINACAQTGSSCGSRVAFNDFMMELTIGNEHQPVFFSVLGGSHPVEEQGQLRVEVRTISETPPDGYYTNDAYRSDITVGDVGIGGESLGAARMEGMLFQKLKTTTRSLD